MHRAPRACQSSSSPLRLGRLAPPPAPPRPPHGSPRTGRRPESRRQPPPDRTGRVRQGREVAGSSPYCTCSMSTSEGRAWRRGQVIHPGLQHSSRQYPRHTIPRVRSPSRGLCCRWGCGRGREVTRRLGEPAGLGRRRAPRPLRPPTPAFSLCQPHGGCAVFAATGGTEAEVGRGGEGTSAANREHLRPPTPPPTPIPTPQGQPPPCLAVLWDPVAATPTALPRWRLPSISCRPGDCQATRLARS